MSTVAGVCAFGVAMFPTDEGDLTLVGAMHYAFAASLLLILAWFSILQFTKSSHLTASPNKLKRNRIYVVCSYTILAALIILLLEEDYESGRKAKWLESGFWLEALCLQAFGFSWMVKGEVILED